MKLSRLWQKRNRPEARMGGRATGFLPMFWEMMKSYYGMIAMALLVSGCARPEHVDTTVRSFDGTTPCACVPRQPGLTGPDRRGADGCDFPWLADGHLYVQFAGRRLLPRRVECRALRPAKPWSVRQDPHHLGCQRKARRQNRGRPHAGTRIDQRRDPRTRRFDGRVHRDSVCGLRSAGS